MWVGVLGPTVVSHAGRPVAVQAAKHRALLAALVLHGARPAAPDALVEAIWGEDAPPSAPATLQTYVSVIRRTLEPDLAARSPSSYLLSSDHGYVLQAESDAAAFTEAVRATHDAIAPLTSAAVPVASDPTAAELHLAELGKALGLWRGMPYADLPACDAVTPERARLQELRVLALEDRATLLVACGKDAEAIAELEALTAEHPLRERPWTLLAAALARTGRHADALAALDRLRSTLDEELGLEPSAAVNELQTAILRHEVRGAEAPAEVRPAAGPTPPQPPRIIVPDWPLVGREVHLQGLTTLLDRAEAGRPRFVSIVGEAGTGKTRLGSELALRAQERGTLLVIGRCSQEEDAPPLWPWTEALGLQPPTTRSGEDHDAARFAVAEEVRLAVTELARDQTVLLGLEDLHWADPSSLRVLRHLCTHLALDLNLLVACTWRPSAEATNPQLAETAAALARRHAARIELGGLSPAETAELLSAVAGSKDQRLATTMHQRTEGNPFFLIEYGRLARDENRGLEDGLDGLPPTVAAVVQRRIAQLPAETAQALTAGAVIGREFGLDLLAPALDRSELDVLDLLEPALEVDLVQDLGGDRFRFGHALVRDAAYGTLSLSRRERLHARIAELVEKAPDAELRAPEVARHWEAAGPRHIRNAHRAAAAAGELAMTAHAADEASEHFETAVALHRGDPAGTPHELCELLLRHADACRWSTRRLAMQGAIDEAVLLAGELGEPELVVRAEEIAIGDAMWPARAYGEHNVEVIAVLRRTLASLPDDDSPVRCRLLLALGSEGYYAFPPEETRALCEEAVETARRLGDPALLVETLAAAAAIDYRRSTAVIRRGWCEEGIALAREVGNERAVINLRALLACARCELGDLDGLHEEMRDVAEEAHREKLYFTEMVVLTLIHSWAAMRGDAAEIKDVTARLAASFDLVSTAHKVDTVRGAALFVPLWDPDAPTPEAGDIFEYMEQSAIPVAPAAAVLAIRRGMVEEARFLVDTFGIDLETDNWFSFFLWSLGAELGLQMQLPEVAASAYRKLAPYAGTCVMSGTSPAHGPVDAYLALAAAATGELSVATRHADDAMTLLAQWDVPLVERWLVRLREQYAF